MAPTPAPLGKQYSEESEWSFKSMTKINEPNLQRRRFLTTATSFVAGAGLAGAAIPFVQSWNPSAKAEAAGAPVKLDPGKIEPGAMITVAWQGWAEVQHALFFCPCHGSKFDLTGRVFKDVPAPTNLIIPPHQYLDNGMLEIGADEQTSSS
jgi:ubiquinol-cytochrome c reductase iron-sulfur subunit